jgi:hypothetical protein
MKNKEDYNFNVDLNDGEKGEQIIVNFLEKHNFKLQNDNKDNKYDLRMINNEGKLTTFEIKTDVYCYPETFREINGRNIRIPGNDTGNIFIEKECRGKLSGISVTKANWFVTYYPYLNQAWFIKTNKLKKLIDENELYLTENSGDIGSNTKGYLINRELFKNHFKIQKIDAKWEN